MTDADDFDDGFEFSSDEIQRAMQIEQERANVSAGPTASEVDDDDDEAGLLTHACETLRRVFGFAAARFCVVSRACRAIP
jgi:hypothetical protein